MAKYAWYSLLAVVSLLDLVSSQYFTPESGGSGNRRQLQPIYNNTNSFVDSNNFNNNGGIVTTNFNNNNRPFVSNGNNGFINNNSNTVSNNPFFTNTNNVVTNDLNTNSFANTLPSNAITSSNNVNDLNNGNFNNLNNINTFSNNNNNFNGGTFDTNGNFDNNVNSLNNFNNNANNNNFDNNINTFNNNPISFPPLGNPPIPLPAQGLPPTPPIGLTGNPTPDQTNTVNSPLPPLPPQQNNVANNPQPQGQPQPGGQVQQCHLRSCDQTITGRRLSYSRALEIVQNEEYLSAADLDIIRRHRHRLFKRQSFTNFPVVSPVTDDEPVDDDDDDCTSYCNLDDYLRPGLGFGLVGLLGLIMQTPSTPNQPPPQQPPPQQPAQTPPQAPSAPLTTAALPGAIGGGILPIGASLVVLEAVALAPPGTTPVSAFPPYIRQRTFNAVSVIFREDGGALASSRNGRRLSLLDRFRHKMTNFFKTRRRYKRGSNNVFRRMRRLLRRGWERVRGRARDQQQHQDFNYGQEVDHHHHDGHNQGGDYGNNNNGQQQIFQNELFGFRVRVRIVENQPCALGVTCDAAGNKLSPNRGFNFNFLRRFGDPGETQFLERQVDEPFESDAPPECRVTLNPDGCI